MNISENLQLGTLMCILPTKKKLRYKNWQMGVLVLKLFKQIYRKL